MNEECPVCGVRFDRGQSGYFLGAMFISYFLSIPVIALLTLLGSFVFPAWSLFKLVFLAWVIFLPSIPLIWQYSRVLWIHFDRWLDP